MMANRIFSETSPLDELIGLAIYAGIMTIDPHRKLDPPFKEHIETVAKLINVSFTNLENALGFKIEEYNGELARMAIRKLAHSWLDKFVK